MFHFLKKIFGTSQTRTIKRFTSLVHKVNECEQKFSALSEAEVKAKTEEFRRRLTEGEALDNLLPEAYALVKNVCRRLCGTEVHVSGYTQKWDMVPYDVQVIGAIAMHYGAVAEMQTGEGKTLTAVMPLYLNALTGDPVHLVTVNDYLAERDSQWVGSPILHWLGLTTGVLTHNTPPQQRKEIYKRDVVYGTASEFGFDYLRDNSMSWSKQDQVQRGYYFAIVDEIDSILIDDARTPLIISGPTPQSRQMYAELKESVSELAKMQRDYCNRIAQEASRIIESLLKSEQILSSLPKESQERVNQACRTLWIVSKGMPRHKVVRKARENPDLREGIDKWDVLFHSDQYKQERAEALSQLFIVVDEKSNEFELTDRGSTTWAEQRPENSSDFVMLDLGHEYAQIDADPSLSDEAKIEQKIAANEEDSRRKERAHNIRQLLRAHLMMERDIDYIIEDQKIVIIDENTGRPQPGRRFSDGLHQAIEAKEGVAIQQETQTYATVTLQNYFRMYKKLAGMSGTAITEASELKDIYSLDVLQIPTYKDCKRVDFDDQIYMTEREKYTALLNEIKKIHEQGRPILIGTPSVDASETVSRILKQNRIEHTVLNAKNHAREAEIIAFAGQRGSITVSTNMAGRGTDIKLGPDVASLGGLHVVGMTRHPARRIDRQLRGRSARLGDPGSSIFFVSFEDQLLRLFASPGVTALLKRFRPPEGEAISASILNKSIETAQKRVENRDFMRRKHTLEYDDVMNKQRQEIYNFRNEVLWTEDLIPKAKSLIFESVALGAEEFFIDRSYSEGWNAAGYVNWLAEHFPVTFDAKIFEDDLLTIDQIQGIAADKIMASFEQKLQISVERAKKAGMEAHIQDMVQNAILSVIIAKIDELWQEQLHLIDHLRTEVSLRSVGDKRDPLLEFKQEAFRLFHELSRRLHIETARNLFKIELIPHHSGLLEGMLSQMHLETNRLLFDEDSLTTSFNSGSLLSLPNEQRNEIKRSSAAKSAPATAPVVLTSEARSGRNDLCPCNSGKKYKRCCGLISE